jgi:hypothetical protein
MTLKAFSVYRRIWKGSKGSDLDAVMNFDYLSDR